MTDPAAPPWTRRTARDCGADPGVPFADALALARELDRIQGSHHSDNDSVQILVGLASRPAVTAAQAKTLLASNRLAVRAALLANPRTRDLKAVSGRLEPDDLFALLGDPQRWAVDIVELLNSQHDLRSHTGPGEHWMTTTVRAALGPDLLAAALASLIAGDDHAKAAAARSPLLDDTGWDALLDAAANAPAGSHAGWLTVLSRRDDLTPQRAVRAWQAAKGHHDEPDILLAAARLGAAPDGAFQDLLARTPYWSRRFLADSQHLPDAIRWQIAAADPDTLDAAQPAEPIPTDAAMKIIAALPAGPESAEAARPLLSLTRDPQVWDAVLDLVLALAPDDQDALLDRAGRARHERQDGPGTAPFEWFADAASRPRTRTRDTGRQDAVLAYLAARPEPAARSLAVASLVHPGDLAGAAQDPSRQVRAAVAAHDLVPPGLLAALAADPDRQVRLAVVRRPGLPTEILARLATDTDPEVAGHVAGIVGDALLDADRWA